MDCNRNVRVEFGDSWGGDIGARLADILRLEEELRGEVGYSNRSGVVKGEGFDTGEGNVLSCEGLFNGPRYPSNRVALTNFHTKPLQAYHENVRRAHALHGLVAEHIPRRH